MSATSRWLRKQLPGILALVLVASTFMVARLPGTATAEQDRLAAQYAFAPVSLAMPGGLPHQSIRAVNQDYQHIDAWISSVGAGVALNDLDGDKLANDLCISDPRTDQVVVTPAPDGKAPRYEPFTLDTGSLPMNENIAPMGCLPGDFNEDGRTDLLVYYWGRTPIVFLARPEAAELNAEAYQPTELVPGASSPGRYDGPMWNSNAVAYDDFDGDGHADVLITNYFPDGPVLDDSVSGGVAMNHSMSNAQNGGENHFFLWNGATTGQRPSVDFRQVGDPLPPDVGKGWELGAASSDLDGDGLPEVYLANDFGPDRLLHNRSTPGRLDFTVVEHGNSPVVPKSKLIGRDSFKGMGVDFGDLDGDGLYDMFVSNITTSWGIEESNFQFMNTAADHAEVRDRLNAGEPPFTDRSAAEGTAWSGWGWDVKVGDFANSGQPAIAQATGFVKGAVNRWPQLQELATSNDALLANPFWWPNVTAGDDIAGSQPMRFYVRTADERYVDLAARLGLDTPVPTRGIATGDTNGDGRLDLAVARQWDEPVLYRNDSQSGGQSLGLRLLHDTPEAPGAMPAAGSPVIGAQVTVTTPDGRKHVAAVDGGGGHSGKRSNEVHIGLGDVRGPVDVNLKWRDRAGQLHEQDLKLAPGRHELRLGTQAKEN